MDTERRRSGDRRELPGLPEHTAQLLAGCFTEQQQEALREVWGLNARTLAEVQQIVRGQWLTLQRGLLALAVIALAAGALSVVLLVRQGGTVASVHTNQAGIAQLARSNRALAQRALSLGHAIQRERVDACRDQNHRNRETVKRLQRFVAHEPPDQQTAAQRKAGVHATIALINALAPTRSCATLTGKSTAPAG